MIDASSSADRIDEISRLMTGTASATPDGPLPPGSVAPDFRLRDQNNQWVRLDGLRTDKKVLVVFFPLAFTGTCEGELALLRDRQPDFDNDETALVAISVGPPPTHKVWSAAQGFLFPILSDFWPHGVTASEWGVFNTRAGYANRGTFVVDTDGVITFSDMVGPGQARDASLWERALHALAP